MGSELDGKKEAFARIIEGRVVHDEGRVQVCLKGTMLGFPATLEAIGPGFPFGVNYFIETRIVDDPNKPHDLNALKMTFVPRVAHGLMALFARVLLVEAKGMRIGDKKIEDEFIVTYNNSEEAQRFITYPGVQDKLHNLHKYAKFSELLVKTEAGLWMQQPVNFKTLDPDLFRETFKLLADLGQVLFEAF